VSIFADDSVGPYPADARVGPLGWAPWAEGLGNTLRRVHEALPGRPLVVTAGGVPTPAEDPRQDEWRVEILGATLAEVRRAVDDGLPLRGFVHRPGIDGYEWEQGFDVHRGLFDRDRHARGSAEVMAEAAGVRPDLPSPADRPATTS
jgi:beta-glucosidase